MAENRRTSCKMLARLCMLLSLLQMTRGQTTERYCGNTPADVAFLLDSSNSMWLPDFVTQLQFVSNVTDMFDIGRNATQVSVVTFNDDVHLQFYLHEYRDKERLQRAINMVQKSYGLSTATDKALKFLRTRVFSPKHGARQGVPRVAIVITDGQSDHTLRTLIEATKVKKNNIILFAIGVGKLVNAMELERMASNPAEKHAFAVDNFSFLDSIKEKLAIRTCLVTTPPPTTTVATTTTTTTTTTAIPETASTTAASTSSLPTTAPTSQESSSSSSTAESTTTESTTSPTPPPTTMTTTTTTTIVPLTTTTTDTTTSPSPTTTTIPISTTTTWVDTVRTICEKKPVDVVFGLDSSSAVSAKDFWYQVKFVRDFTLGLDIGFNKTRIGVVVYNDSVNQVFDINDHESLASAVSDLYKIQQSKGGSRVDKVIHHVRTRSFRRTLSRREAAQLLVLITASPTTNLHRIKKEANKAKNTGVHIIAIGVGEKVKVGNLRIIAGADDNKEETMLDDFSPFLDSSSMRRRQIFHTPQFQDLQKIVMEATIEACTAEVASVAFSDQACGTRQEADMMFVMDSSSAGKKNTKKALDLVKAVTQAIDVSADTVQIGMVQPDDCVPSSDSFGLNSHRHKDRVISALETPVDEDKLSTLLNKVRKDAFQKNNGGRKDAKKIAVVFVDGELEHPLKVLKEARRAQIHGIELYVVFVGVLPPQQEVVDMCAYPPDRHFLQVPDYDHLKDVENSLIELLCDEL